MKAPVSKSLDLDQEQSYLEFSKALHGFVEQMVSFNNADFAKFSRPYLESQAKALKDAECMFREMASQAEKTLSTTDEDHPHWEQAKRNFYLTTTTVSELSEILRRLEQFIETGHFDRRNRQ